MNLVAIIRIPQTAITVFEQILFIEARAQFGDERNRRQAGQRDQHQHRGDCFLVHAHVEGHKEHAV